MSNVDPKVRALLRQPWTVRVRRNQEDGYLVAEVSELPDVIATGATEDELEADLWESLQASLECRLHYGDPIPVPAPIYPAGSTVAKQRPSGPMPTVRMNPGEAWETSLEAGSMRVPA